MANKKAMLPTQWRDMWPIRDGDTQPDQQTMNDNSFSTQRQLNSSNATVSVQPYPCMNHSFRNNDDVLIKTTCLRWTIQSIYIRRETREQRAFMLFHHLCLWSSQQMYRFCALRTRTRSVLHWAEVNQGAVRLNPPLFRFILSSTDLEYILRGQWVNAAVKVNE